MKCEKYDKLTLLSFVTGDLSGGAAAEVESHLRECSDCAAFVDNAGKEQAAFLDAYPSISGNAVPVQSSLVRFPVLRTALALAAGLVLAVGTGTLLVNRSASDFRTKGGVTLKLFVEDSLGVPVECDTPVCAPGERIQFTYSCGKERYFVLMSVDTSGSFSVFYPDRGDSSVVLEPGNGLPLPNSIVLDDYIGREWYVAVFSSQPLGVAALVDKLHASLSGKNGINPVSFKIDNATVRTTLLTKRNRRQ